MSFLDLVGITTGVTTILWTNAKRGSLLKTGLKTTGAIGGIGVFSSILTGTSIYLLSKKPNQLENINTAIGSFFISIVPIVLTTEVLVAHIGTLATYGGTRAIYHHFKNQKPTRLIRK